MTAAQQTHTQLELDEVLARLNARAMDAPALDPLYPQDPNDEDPEPPVKADVEFEMPRANWEPRIGRADCPDPPRRFIDGSMKPHLVMSLEDAARGRPRPVVLATLGAVALDLVHTDDGHEQLTRHAYTIDTCLAFLANGIASRDVDILRRACESEGIQVVAPPTDQISTDFDEVRRHTLEYLRRRMLALEADLLRGDPLTGTIIDGLLDQRLADFTSHNLPAVGVVKRQLRTYLHSRGVRLVYGLRQGERSPAILLDTSRGEFVSFYLRLGKDNGAMPHSGVVRVMISKDHFEAVGSSWNYLDGLAHWITKLRCRRTSYTRAAISLEPIVHAEEHIKSLLPDLGERVGKFNRIMGLNVAAAGRVA